MVLSSASITRRLAGLLFVIVLPLHAEVITVYGSDEFPPVSYMNAGVVAGAFPAILSRLEKETGDRYEIQLVPWARALWMAQREQGAVANISWTTERSMQMDYSVPIYPTEVVLVVKKGREFRFESLSDLKGKLIGAGLGSSYRDEVDAAIARGDILVDRDPNQLNRMRKLLSGRVDAIFVGAGRVGVKTMIESTPEFKDRADEFVVLPKVVAVDPLHLAIPKSLNKTEALQRLNRAYTKLKERGDLADLLPR
ncbi:substrate-binding periplasmic protein [Hydrogenophaga atypica]|uniref:Substrate-binding periplasmic protein n=2 Tax=Hydrogenophaga atypica TaxID=249409 RepID=A0ABW2QL24_9BURK